MGIITRVVTHTYNLYPAIPTILPLINNSSVLIPLSFQYILPFATAIYYPPRFWSSPLILHATSSSQWAWRS